MAAEPIPAQIAAACAAVRPATPADAVAGRAAADRRRPGQHRRGEHAAAGRPPSSGSRSCPRGTGSRLHWGNPPERCDLVVETTRTGRGRRACGRRPGGHRAGGRAPGPARRGARRGWPAARARPAWRRRPVGGVLAAGAAGPLRLRYGTGRDLLIGITVVRADGTIARSGGKVVKNVAGYDLGKLFAGSRGTLGLITQATFRLHPLPADDRVRDRGVPEPAVDACQRACRRADVSGQPRRGRDRLASRERSRPGLRCPGGRPGQRRRAGDRAGRPARPLSAAPSVRAGTADLVGRGPGGPARRHGAADRVLARRPGMVLAEIRAAAEAAGLDPAVGGSAAAGVLHAALPADRDPGAVAAFVAVLRDALGHGLPADAGHRLSTPRSRCCTPDPAPGLRRPTSGAAGPEQTAPPPTGGSRRSGEGPPARANVVVQHAPPAVASSSTCSGRCRRCR